MKVSGKFNYTKASLFICKIFFMKQINKNLINSSVICISILYSTKALLYNNWSLCIFHAFFILWLNNLLTCRRKLNYWKSVATWTRNKICKFFGPELCLMKKQITISVFSFSNIWVCVTLMESCNYQKIQNCRFTFAE